MSDGLPARFFVSTINFMYMTTKSDRKFKVPTDEEDEKISAAAESDPDACPWTGEELAQVKQVQRGQPFFDSFNKDFEAKPTRAPVAPE